MCLGYVKQNDDIIYCYYDDYINNTIPKYKLNGDNIRSFNHLDKNELNEISIKYNNGESIRSIAKEHNIFIIIDDPYCDFLYENSEHYFNLASAEEFKDHVI